METLLFVAGLVAGLILARLYRPAAAGGSAMPVETQAVAEIALDEPAATPTPETASGAAQETPQDRLARLGGRLCAPRKMQLRGMPFPLPACLPRVVALTPRT